MIDFHFHLLGLLFRVEAGFRLMRWNVASIGRQHALLFGAGFYEYPSAPKFGRMWYLVLPGFRLQVGASRCLVSRPDEKSPGNPGAFCCPGPRPTRGRPSGRE